MNKMKKDTRDKIFRDYERAKENIDRIINGGRNFIVINSNQYLNPTISSGEICDLDNPNGEFEHYRKIRDGLEMVLAGAKYIKISHHFTKAPDYIQQFLS